MTHRLPLIAVLVLLLGVAAQAADKPKGYLTPVQTPDTKLILPPAPAEGTPRYDADRAIFKATRRFSTDAARWAMAQNDDHYESTYLAADFACAVGADFAPAKAPKLWATVDRANVDLLRAMADVEELLQAPAAVPHRYGAAGADLHRHHRRVRQKLRLSLRPQHDVMGAGPDPRRAGARPAPRRYWRAPAPMAKAASSAACTTPARRRTGAPRPPSSSPRCTA